MASEGKKRKLDVDDDTKNAHYTPVMPDRDNFNRTEYCSESVDCIIGLFALRFLRSGRSLLFCTLSLSFSFRLQ
jgi:hypothetical protein